MKKIAFTLAVFLSSSLIAAEGNRTVDYINQIHAFCNKIIPTTDHEKNICNHTTKKAFEDHHWQNFDDVVGSLLLSLESNTSLSSNQRKAQAAELLILAQLLSDSNLSKAGFVKKLEDLSK